MAANSKIEWTDHTFNPWRGCTKVSAGCANCYAETLSGRNPKTLGVWGPQGTRVVASEAMWREPVKWNREAEKSGTRPRVFCASLADVFEDWTDLMSASDGAVMHVCSECGAWRTMEQMCHGPNAHMPLTMPGVRHRLFAIIDATPNLDWLLLTKRPENIARMMPEFQETMPFFDEEEAARQPNPFVIDTTIIRKRVQVPGVRPNVWLGVSCENQQSADERIPHLLQVPAKVRFLSCEPLLGPVEIDKGPGKRSWLGSFTGTVVTTGEKRFLPGIDWVIVGGESGHGARPMRPEWVRSIVHQCKAAGVPVFVKQMGANVITRNDLIEDAFNDDGTGWPEPDLEHNIHGFREEHQGADCRIRLHDRKGSDWNEWPADLRVREFPTVEAPR